MVTAAKNPDGSIAIVIFNEGEIPKSYDLTLGQQTKQLSISPQAIQTIMIKD